MKTISKTLVALIVSFGALLSAFRLRPHAGGTGRARPRYKQKLCVR